MQIPGFQPMLSPTLPLRCLMFALEEEGVPGAGEGISAELCGPNKSVWQ